MWRKIIPSCYCNHDSIKNDPEETGFDRVKKMFFRSEYGLISPQMYFLVQNASATLIGSAFVGAIIHMVKAKQEYLRKNVASTYESQYLAKRHLTDHITLSGVKGALKFSLKYGSFSSLYMLCTMTAACYNNKVTIYEHIGAGALVGAFSRFNFGPKGMAAAACLGGVLGAFTGGTLLSYMWIMKVDYKDIDNLQVDSYYAMRRRRPAH